MKLTLIIIILVFFVSCVGHNEKMSYSNHIQQIDSIVSAGINKDSLETLLAGYKAGRDDVERMVLMRELGRSYRESSDFGKALDYHEEALSLAKELKDTSNIIFILNQLGTDTGRLSSGGKDKANGIEYLNFQNFPADSETRACFIAGKGMKWISCDYSGQESRIIADVTNDPAMIDLFNNGCGDIHSLVAKMAYPDVIGDCPVEQIKKKFKHWRSKAKGVEFGINYGGDYNTLHANKGIPIEEAKAIYNNYMKGFKGVKTYQDAQRKFVMEHGYIIVDKMSQRKAYIYDYDTLMGIKARFTQSFWAAYKPYKGKENNMLPKAVKQELYQRFAGGDSFEGMTGVYNYTTKKAGKEVPREAFVSIADVYVLPVKHYFKRKSASEKQAINYP